MADVAKIKHVCAEVVLEDDGTPILINKQAMLPVLCLFKRPFIGPYGWNPNGGIFCTPPAGRPIVLRHRVQRVPLHTVGRSQGQARGGATSASKRKWLHLQWISAGSAPAKHLLHSGMALWCGDPDAH